MFFFSYPLLKKDPVLSHAYQFYESYDFASRFEGAAATAGFDEW